VALAWGADVAQVFRPEAVVFEFETKCQFTPNCLTSEEVSYIKIQLFGADYGAMIIAGVTKGQ